MSFNSKRKHNETQSSDEEDYQDQNGTIIDGIYIPPPVDPVCSTTPSGPRLIITKIKNNFFKSYPQDTDLGPFHKCFNSIIGPNGSGKSNVIDAMLFVFGYRATRIRSKNTAVLIHNSEQYTNVQSCTVTVYFAHIIDKEGDDYDIVPGSEFFVSRTANKDNTSFYEINGKRVVLKDISILLKKNGIDLDHNRFLILQGEVEQISMMKAKAENEHDTGMLEYLEDIIGTSRYKKPLKQLDERVKVLSEQRNEKLNRLKLIEKELEDLKEPLDEAVSFLKEENNLIRQKNVYFQKKIFDVKNEMEDFKEEKEKIDKHYKDLNNELEETIKEKQEKEKILKKESTKYEALKKKQNQQKETFDKANKKDVQLQANMTQMVKDRKKCKEQLAEEKKKMEKLLKIPEKNEADIIEIKQREEELLIEKDEIEKNKEKILDTLKNETKDLQIKKEDIQNDLAVLKAALNEAHSAYKLAESELEIATNKEKTDNNKLKILQENYSNKKENIKILLNKISELKNKLPKSETKLNELLKEFQKINQQEQHLKEEHMKKRINLEETKSSMQASRSRGKVLDALMEQKKSGNCPGLYGRLGDLGAIDLKYDIAISTACGLLDNIIVDTVETAMWCIEFLKKYNIGRADFMALEKQEHLRQLAETLIKTPENVHRLYDLIKVEDPTIKTAFYYALRNTLVANDIDQATRVAFGEQRFRVVTLKGDVIETSGTISGGGKTVMKGKMGQSVASITNINPHQEVNLMEKNLNKIEENIRNLREKSNTLEKEINLLQHEINEGKHNLKMFEVELDNIKQSQPQLAQQIKEQEIKCKLIIIDPENIKHLTNIVEKKKNEYERALEATKDLQNEADKLTKLIKDKTSSKMNNIEKKLKNITETINKCRVDITKLTVDIKTSQRNYKKSMEKIKNIEADIERMETNLRQMKSEREEIEQDAKILLKSIEQVAIELNDGVEDYSKIKEEVKELIKKENKLKSEKVDIDNQVKTASEKMNGLENNLINFTKDINQLTLQEIPNENIEPFEILNNEQLDNVNIKDIIGKIKHLDEYLKNQKPNLGILTEYRTKQRFYLDKLKELDEISEKKNQMKQLHEKLIRQRKEEFLIGYNIIKLKLKETYQMITLGGDADFEMIDTFDPFTQGIQFNVRPPKKSWKNISNLSGGEKTLSSLALVFALHYYKPSPFYVMDEIDAALDFKNVSIVANYIKERTRNAQFIIISLRNNMFELCENLIGIYKTFNTTKTITIDPRNFEDEECNKDEQNVADPQENPNFNVM